MSNLVISPTDDRVIVEVEYVRSTLKEKYGFKADIDDLPPIRQNPALGRTKYLVFIASKIAPKNIIEVENIDINPLLLEHVRDYSYCLPEVFPINALGYFFWMSAGELYRNKEPRTKMVLGLNEREGTMGEGLHLFSQYGARDGLADLEKGNPHMHFTNSYYY